MTRARSLVAKATRVTVSISFSLYSIAGCGGSGASTKHLVKYENEPYTDFVVFHDAKDPVYKASIRAFQEKGFIVTLSDPQTGLISAESNVPAMIPEDQKLQEDAEEASRPSTILIILGIVFLVGLVLILVAALSGSSEEKDEEDEDDGKAGVDRKDHDGRAHDHGVHVITTAPEPRTSYRYVVSLTLTAQGVDSTSVQVSATRFRLSNGAVAGSAPMENKYLNYSLFDEIQEQVGLGR